MTILEQRFLETVPTRLSDIAKELKEINSSLSELITLIEEPSNEKEE